jgi:hypothetical protein
VSFRIGTFVVFAALALRMREKRRTHTEKERLQRQNRKEMQGDCSPKAFPPRKVTIPASEGPIDDFPSSVAGESWLRNDFSNRRSPGNRDVSQQKDHTLVAQPVGPQRSGATGGVPGEREPLLNV